MCSVSCFTFNTFIYMRLTFLHITYYFDTHILIINDCIDRSINYVSENLTLNYVYIT